MDIYKKEKKDINDFYIKKRGKKPKILLQ